MAVKPTMVFEIGFHFFVEKSRTQILNIHLVRIVFSI